MTVLIAEGLMVALTILFCMTIAPSEYDKFQKYCDDLDEDND